MCTFKRFAFPFSISKTSGRQAFEETTLDETDKAKQVNETVSKPDDYLRSNTARGSGARE